MSKSFARKQTEEDGRPPLALSARAPQHPDVSVSARIQAVKPTKYISVVSALASPRVVGKGNLKHPRAVEDASSSPLDELEPDADADPKATRSPVYASLAPLSKHSPSRLSCTTTIKPPTACFSTPSSSSQESTHRPSMPNHRQPHQPTNPPTNQPTIPSHDPIPSHPIPSLKPPSSLDDPSQQTPQKRDLGSIRDRHTARPYRKGKANGAFTCVRSGELAAWRACACKDPRMTLVSPLYSHHSHDY